MKIGIITSGSENLALFAFLSTYNHEYIVYYDFSHRPYGDKTFEQSLACVQKGIEYLTQQGVDHIIVPPTYELHIMQNAAYKVQKKNILPIFSSYLLEYCFKYSLIGKLGVIGDFADVSVAQPLIQDLAKTYILTDSQKNIKKFHFPFVSRLKETPLWKYYLTSLSYSHILVNKIIKFDLRYFKDAAVDTVIPLNYGYFHYQTTITKFLNFKKIRFHGLEKLQDIFVSLKVPASKSYSVKVAYTGTCEFLTREKRLMQLLQRGKKVEVMFEKVD